VTLLFTPDADDLGHDARQIGVHEPSVQRWIGALCDQVQNAYTHPTHAEFSSWGIASITTDKSG
jgi:hypothetical protein